jgi:hypothetical protein
VSAGLNRDGRRVTHGSHPALAHHRPLPDDFRGQVFDGIILRFPFPGTKARKDYTYEPTVSVLMPCYNEAKTVYEKISSISKSNYPN